MTEAQRELGAVLVLANRLLEAGYRVGELRLQLTPAVIELLKRSYVAPSKEGLRISAAYFGLAVDEAPVNGVMVLARD